jgi:hypothetical protein
VNYLMMVVAPLFALTVYVSVLKVGDWLFPRPCDHLQYHHDCRYCNVIVDRMFR